MLTNAATTMIANVTTGPATATRNSWPGDRVSLFIFITPPKKNRSMPLTPMPSRRATTAWPSSCSRIDPKKPKAAATAVQNASDALPSTSSNELLRTKMKRNRTKNHETFTPMRMPMIVPSRIELPPSTGCQWWHSLAGWLSRPGCAARSAPVRPGQDQTVEFLKEMNS